MQLHAMDQINIFFDLFQIIVARYLYEHGIFESKSTYLQIYNNSKEENNVYHILVFRLTTNLYMFV